MQDSSAFLPVAPSARFFSFHEPVRPALQQAVIRVRQTSHLDRKVLWTTPSTQPSFQGIPDEPAIDIPPPFLHNFCPSLSYSVLPSRPGGRRPAARRSHAGASPHCLPLPRRPGTPSERWAVDLAEKLGQAMGRRSVFTEGNRDELLDMLAKGNIDYICGLPQPLVPDGARVQTLTTSFATNRRILVGNSTSI